MRLFSIFCFGFLAFLIAAPTTEVNGWGSADVNVDGLPSRGKKSLSAGAKVTRDDQTGIREVVAHDARQRYQGWKEEMLSTEFGRRWR